MSKQYDSISADLGQWIRRQQMFFISTAPLAAAGHINCSPKGGDSFRILGPTEVAYQDYTGSGAETAAHLRENGRILVMFCAFDGPPKIVRLHGTGEVIRGNDVRYEKVLSLFPPNAGTRCIGHITVSRISDSCGYCVPLYDYQKQRDILDKWSESKTPNSCLITAENMGLKASTAFPHLMKVNRAMSLK